MTDIRSLDADNRTFALVGRFLQAWALMESQMSHAIAKALGLTDLQEVVLQKNTQFRDKTNILKTLVAMSYFGETEAARLIKLIGQIYDYSTNRNMMAHDLFMPSEKTDGVEFLVVKARGTLQFPTVDWTVDDFHDAYALLLSYRLEMESLRNRLHAFTSLAAALSAPVSPSLGLGGLGFPGLLSPPDPTLQSSGTGPATDHTAAQTPPSFPEKSPPES